MKAFFSRFSTLCVVLMLLICLSVTAFAADTTESGTAGDNVTWTLDSKGVLTISGTGEMTGSPWRDNYASVIKKVIIEEGVTSIGKQAFRSCSSITEISIPSTVTTVGYEAFSYCTLLKTVVLPEGVTTLDIDAFWQSKVTTLTLPSTLESVGRTCFSGAPIEHLYISDLEQFLSLDLRNANLTFKNLYVDGVLLTELTIPEGMTEIQTSAFNDWTSLESVYIPDSVTEIEANAFSGCTGLKQVRLSENLAVLQNRSFYNCKALESLTIPASVQMINTCAFGYDRWGAASALSAVRFMGNAPLISADAFNNVTTAAHYSAADASWTEDVLLNYGGALTWTADESIPSAGASAETFTVASGTAGDNVTWTLNSKGLLTISGTGQMTSVPWNENYQTVIKRVIIEEGVTSIGKQAFRSCSSVTEISIPSTVTTIGYEAFSYCTLLNTLVLPEGVTTLDTDAFWQSKVTTLTLPSTLESVGRTCFSGAPIEHLYISDLNHFLSLDLRNANLTFHNLYVNGVLLTELTIPDGMTVIQSSAFNDWTSLESVYIPDSVTGIEASAFSGCTGLKQVRLSESLALLQNRSFYNCRALEELTIPASLRSIPSSAFACERSGNTSALSTVRFMGNAPLIAADAFSNITATVYYSAADTSWTEDVLQNYGGTLTWTADDSIPAAGSSSEAFTVASGMAGDSVTWALNSKGLLTIGGTGEMTSAPWKEDYQTVISKVVIEEGVTSIGKQAFRSCSSITEISIPSTVTTVGYEAFSYCTLLTTVVLPEGVTTLDIDAFWQSKVTTLTLPSTLESVGRTCFSGAPIEHLYISDLEQFLSLDLRNASLTFKNLYVDGALLTELTIPESMTVIQTSAFNDWTSLESVYIPDSVTEIEANAFSGCTGLKSVRLPEQLTVLQASSFYNCKALESLTIPASVQVINAKVFGRDRYGDTNALSVVRFMGNAPLIAADAFSNVTANAYYSDNNSTWSEDMKLHYGGTLTWLPDSSIEGPGDVPEVYVIAKGTCGSNVYWVLTSDGQLTITTANMGNRYAASMSADLAPVNAMDNYASAGDAPWAAYAAQIKSVVVEENVGSIGNNAFAELPNLKKVVVSEDVEQVGSGAFADCENLREVSFAGSAPELGENSFQNTADVIINHPADDESWTNAVVSDVGGSVTLKPVETVQPTPKPDVCEHMEEVMAAVAPTCGETGLTEGSRCSLCGEILTAQEVIPATGEHNYVDGECTVCGGADPDREDPKPTIVFNDVAEGQFFYEPVLWAVENGITSGMGANRFAPDDNCTRGQVVTFLWRAAGKPAPTSTEHPFTDIKEGEYYYEAVLWAVENGITSGMSATEFQPNAACTRGHVVTFLWRAEGKPALTSADHPFTDIKEDDYYYNAVLWAVENGITNGLGADSFAPNATCNRGQIVTFLYRGK